MAKKSEKKAAKKTEDVKAIAGTPELGDRVRDKISGFKGIVVVVSTWLNGCVRIQVTSEELKDGNLTPKDGIFDIQQLELLAKNPKNVRPKQDAPIAGGDRDDTIRPNTVETQE